MLFAEDGTKDTAAGHDGVDLLSRIEYT